MKTSYQSWLAEIEQSTVLKRSWSLGLGWGVLSLILFLARCLGSLPVDADPLRAFGAVVATVGAGLLSIGYLLKPADMTSTKNEHHQILSMIVCIAVFLVSIALLPHESLWLILLSALLVVSCALLTGYQLLKLQGTKATDTPPVLSETPLSKQVAVDSLLQWQSRKQQPDGSEILEGMLQLTLAVGQKQVSAHVAITPSFKTIPEIECEPLGDEPIEATVGEVYPHGFRIDVRRTDGVDRSETVQVGFQATASQQNQNAA